MPKYRLLTPNELKTLETEFVKFLAAQGLNADDWETLKSQDQDKIGRMIELFSDIVYENSLRNVRYLDLTRDTEIRAYQCLKDKLVVIGLLADKNSGAKFTDPDWMQQALKKMPSGIQIYQDELKYKDQRELELFRMIERGCAISDGQLFKALALGL